MKQLIPQSIKNIYHLFQAVLANFWCGFPSKELKVIGVTGTNGKTTTVQMIVKVLEEAGFRVAAVSTISFKLGGKEWVNDTKFTTLSSFKLQKFLREAVKAGCEYAILEVSSHSLDQNRTWGVDFVVAVITNVTREHLDYHKTMEEYRKVKERLFERVSKNKEGVSVVNLEMEKPEEFLKHKTKEKYGYLLETQSAKLKAQNHSAKLKTVIAREMEFNVSHTKYKIRNTNFFLNLPGRFNVENALAATCVGLSQNISLEKISQALGEIKGMPGRLEGIENNRGIKIIVDYAVTPDSLEKLYKLIEEMAKRSDRAAGGESGRTASVIAVFGACGERDRGKRPIMGEVVARYADYCIVTNEDPYNEDPMRIIDEVFAGIVGENPNVKISMSKQIPNPKSQIQSDIPNTKYKIPDTKVEGENCWRILDRRDAIKKALRLAKPGDIVVVTGKGVEETMAVGNKRIPWNDPKVIREVLLELEKEKSR